MDSGRCLGFREDFAPVAEFIRRWVTEAGRRSSPKFLVGESYGSRRAAGLAQVLQVQEEMDLNGVVLVSAGSIGRDYADAGLLRHALYFPHFAATAWYHDQLGSELGDQPLSDVLDEVHCYPLDRCARALIQGSRLSAVERARVAERLARYTGLPASFIQRSDLRVERPEFRRELLRGRSSLGRSSLGRTSGRRPRISIFSRACGRRWHDIPNSGSSSPTAISTGSTSDRNSRSTSSPSAPTFA